MNKTLMIVLITIAATYMARNQLSRLPVINKLPSF